MQDDFTFRPESRMGTFFHLLILGVLILVVVFGLWLASQPHTGSRAALYLLPALAAAAFAPVFVYRLYALRSAIYILEREGLRLRWGLRSEDIPIDEILWIHPAAELSAALPMPRWRYPGALLGRCKLPDGGELEYLAADTRDLLMVATPLGGFVISPADPAAFLQTYQRLTELGSLAPLPRRSVLPVFFLARVWSSTTARVLLLIGFGLSLALFLWVSLEVSGGREVPLGFRPDGSAGDRVPTAQLMLLPALNFVYLLAGLSMGLFFFRQEERHAVAYLLWASNAVTALAFLAAVFFILRSA